MRRTREIVGLPVLDMQSGDQVGWVQDVVFDEEKEEVAGVLLEGGHLIQSSKGIPRQAIVSVGKDAVTINDTTVREIPGSTWSQKLGNQVYTQGGDAKGTVEDIFLDDGAERIVGFEVSDGLFADLAYGRGSIGQQHVMVDGKDVLIVDDQASPWDRETRGGFLT